MTLSRSRRDVSTRSHEILPSTRIRVHLLLYERKPTKQQEQYDWMAENNYLDGKGWSCFVMVYILNVNCMLTEW